MRAYILFFALIILFGCNNTNTVETVQEKKDPVIQLPKNAIPFIFDSYIFVKIRVNDSINGNFMFDSGSDQLYLDSSFVARNNIPVNSKRKKLFQQDSIEVELIIKRNAVSHKIKILPNELL